jgi:peptidoglycan/xylan/chitin deacetylase (PgdA/CDA1 family)
MPGQEGSGILREESSIVKKGIIMKNALVPTWVFCLLVTVVFFPMSGCGADEREYSRVNLEGMADAALQAFSDRVEGDHVVTFDASGLQGKLPPALPAEPVTRGNAEVPRVALTIDDGWNCDYRILDLLSEWEITWTAFLIGGRGIAESHPEFVRAVQDAGAEVCTHTYSHYVMAGKDRDFVTSEIWKGQEAITSVTHRIYPYVRFSGGTYDENSLKWASEQGFWMVNWTVSGGDTGEGVTVDYQVGNILSNLEPGAILLFHFGGYNTYEVLLTVIPEIQKRGYEVTSLSRVLEGTPYILKR